MFKFLKRLQKLFLRNYRAKKLGIQFKRSSKFILPDSISWNGERTQLLAPDENGVKMAFIDIFFDDCYGLKYLPKSTAKVLDIRAHIGFFSLASRIAFPNAVIHSYEPNPRLQNYLKHQAEIGRFDYFMEAVGKENGKVSLEYHPDSVQTRSRVDVEGKIPAIAFRKVIQRLGGNVDLVKLDCEGAEWLLFEDAEPWQAVQNVSMEYHLWPNHTHNEIKCVLENLGFSIEKQKRIARDYGLIIASRIKR